MDLEDMGDPMMAEEMTSKVCDIVTPSQMAALKEECCQIVLVDRNHQLCGCSGCYSTSTHSMAVWTTNISLWTWWLLQYKHTFDGITSYH